MNNINILHQSAEQIRNQERYDNQQQRRDVNYRNRRNVKKTTEDTNKTDSNTDQSD